MILYSIKYGDIMLYGELVQIGARDNQKNVKIRAAILLDAMDILVDLVPKKKHEELYKLNKMLLDNCSELEK